MLINGVTIPEPALGSLCQRYRVARLSLFGSILRPDFGPSSDVDILVEFLPDATPTHLTLGAMLMDLQDLIGRRVDVLTPQALSPYFRNRVLREATPRYAA